MLKDKDIKNYIQDIYNKVCEKYGENNILGVFVYGKALYGFAENINDIQYMVSYIPTFEELCFDEINFIGLNNYNVADLRIEMKNFQNQEIRVMECIFSPYNAINPRYKRIYNNQILMNREQLFHYRKRTRVEDALKRGEKALENGDYFEAIRIQIATKMYMNGTSIENCINIKDSFYIAYLKTVLEGAIPDLEDVKNKYKELWKDAEDIEESYSNTKYIAKNFIKEVIKMNINSNNNSIEDFMNSLTKSEKQAWEEIIMEINNYYGIVSISQLVEKSKLSRPVFKSTLDKMEKYGIAEIVNMGVKGTQITILK